MTGRADDLTLDSRAVRGPDHYRFRTRAGVCSPDSFRTAELLLLETAWERDVDHLLCPQANYGLVGVVTAHACGGVTMTESSARARNCCVRNARVNDADATVELLADLSTLDEAFDAAAYAPRPYAPIAAGKQRLVDSLAALRPGGRIFVAASPESGLRRYRTCLETVTDSTERVRERDGVAVVAAVRPAEFEPPTYVRPRTLEPTVGEVPLSLVSVPGVFAASSLDDGTRLLAEAAEIADCGRVLDLCCGYGALGVFAAKAHDCEVWLTDDDRVATRCAERSLEASAVEGTVVTADCVAGVEDVAFDAVLCNPPTHAGSSVLDDLFAGAASVLVSGGDCWFVHHESLDLDRHLSPFATVERIRTGEDHVVWRASP